MHRTLWCEHTALTAQPRWVNKCNQDKKAHSSTKQPDRHQLTPSFTVGAAWLQQRLDLAPHCTACRLEAGWQATQIMLHTKGMSSATNRGSITPAAKQHLHEQQSDVSQHGIYFLAPPLCPRTIRAAQGGRTGRLIAAPILLPGYFSCCAQVQLQIAQQTRTTSKKHAEPFMKSIIAMYIENTLTSEG